MKGWERSARPASSWSDAGAVTVRKHSVTIAGHRTSVSLEGAFWDSLRLIAAERGRSVSELVTEIDRQRHGKLSSAIRVYVLAQRAGRLHSDV